MAPTHALGGASLWVSLSVAVAPLAVVVGGVPVAALCGLLMDLDHHNSRATRAFPPITYPLHLLVKAVYGGHREGAHSLLAFAPVPALLALVPLLIWAPAAWWLSLSVFVGTASHALLDGLTGSTWERAGCCMAWPLSRRRWGVPLLLTDSVAERWVIVPGLVLLPAGMIFLSA